jgi:hypothetical protein
VQEINADILEHPLAKFYVDVNESLEHLMNVLLNDANGLKEDSEYFDDYRRGFRFLIDIESTIHILSKFYSEYNFQRINLMIAELKEIFRARIEFLTRLTATKVRRACQ